MSFARRNAPLVGAHHHEHSVGVQELRGHVGPKELPLAPHAVELAPRAVLGVRPQRVPHELAQVLCAGFGNGGGLVFRRRRGGVVQTIDGVQIVQGHARPPEEPSVDHQHLVVN